MASIPLVFLGLGLYQDEQDRLFKELLTGYAESMIADNLEATAPPVYHRIKLRRMEQPGLFAANGRLTQVGENSEEQRFWANIKQVCEAMEQRDCWQLVALRVNDEEVPIAEVAPARAEPVAEPAVEAAPAQTGSAAPAAVATSEAIPGEAAPAEAPAASIPVATSDQFAEEPQPADAPQEAALPPDSFMVQTGPGQDELGEPAPEALQVAPEPPPADPTLVTHVQRQLIVLGFDQPLGLAVDGLLGPQTRLAIKAFQRQYGLDESGRTNPELIQTLDDAVAVRRRDDTTTVAAPASEPETPAPATDYQLATDPSEPAAEPEPMSQTTEPLAEPEAEAAPIQQASPEESPAPSAGPTTTAGGEPAAQIATMSQPAQIASQSSTLPSDAPLRSSLPQPSTAPQIAMQSSTLPDDAPLRSDVPPATATQSAALPATEPQHEAIDEPEVVEAAPESDAPAAAPEVEWSPTDESLLFLIQDRLIKLGYSGTNPLPRDGKLTPRTEAAIKVYQQEHGLADDGQPSKALLAHMEDKLRRGVTAAQSSSQ